MGRLAGVAALSLAAVLVASVACADANDAEGPWTLTPPDHDAFTVRFSVYTEPAPNGLYYYQWDVTLNPGAQACDTAGVLQDLEWIKGLYFDIPGDTEGPVDNLYGPKTLVNGELVDLAWSFQPRESRFAPRDGTAGEWSGSGPTTYLYASQNGEFVAGVWLNTLFELGGVYDLQFHVGNGTGDITNTGFINWQTELTENYDPPPPPPTPELATWLLLACSGGAGALFGRRRKAKV